MMRLLIMLALGLAAATGTVSLWDGAGSMTLGSAGGTLASLHPPSVIAGIAAGLFLGWVRRLPWSEIPGLMRAAIARWTRGFGLLGLALLAAGVLLYY